MTVNITIKNVDLDLLQVQVDELCNLLNNKPDSLVWGIVEMLGDQL